MTEQTIPVRPGRKRSEASRRAIVTAAWELLAEVGYGRLSIEGIAARSGTGKQTIRRWWPSKADVVQDALAGKADLEIPIPDEGSYAADLRAFLEATFALGRDPAVASVLRGLMAHAQLDAGFSERFRGSFLNRRRDALGRIIERAQSRGELPQHPTPAVVSDVVFGVIWYRLLATGQPLDRSLVDELVATLTAGTRHASSGVGPRSRA